MIRPGRRSDGRTVQDRTRRSVLPAARAASGPGERGASLVFALVFITTFAFVISAVLTMGRDSLATGGSLESYRIQSYGADGALDLGIAGVRANVTQGREGEACPTRSMVLDSGATAQVTCTALSGSGAQVTPPGAGLSHALITEPATGETGVEVTGAKTTARVRGPIATGSATSGPSVPSASAPDINGGLSWGGWINRGRSDQAGLWAGGATNRPYEVYTTTFTFDPALNVVTGSPIQSTDPAIPRNFDKGTQAGNGKGFTHYNQGDPTLANATGRPVTSGGAFAAGNLVLGIGVRVLDNARFETVPLGANPDGARGQRWGGWRFMSFGLNQGSNTSFAPASTVGGTDGRTSFGYTHTGDFAANFDPGAARFTTQEMPIVTAEGAQWGGPSVNWKNLAGGFQGPTGGGVSYDFAVRVFGQDNDASDVHTYQMFVDLTAVSKLYGPDATSEDSILDLRGTAYAATEGVGTIDPRKLVVRVNGWGDTQVVVSAVPAGTTNQSTSMAVSNGSTLAVAGASTASGNCTGTITPAPSCNSSGFTALRDAAYAPFSAAAPDLSSLPARSVPACPSTSPNYVALQPGEYTSAAAMSALTDGSCPNAIVHLLPGVFRFRFGGGGVWVLNDPTVNVVAGEPYNWTVPTAGSASGQQAETALADGGFEAQATAQNLPDDCVYTAAASCRSGQGASWTGSWGSTYNSSWQATVNGVWSGGAIARSEDYATGWKWARGGNVFGIVKDRQTLSQTFTATRSGTGTLSWFDANRAAWRTTDWYGMPNSYSVTITDGAGNVQTVGNYSSVVAGGNSWSSPPACWDAPTNNYCWWTTLGKTTWFPKTGTGFTLQAGVTYTLRFNSLAPTDCVNDQCDRTTFLDDISLSVTPAAAAGRPRLDELTRLCKTDADPAPNEGTLLVFDADARMDVRAIGPSEFCGSGATWSGQRVSVFQAADAVLADPAQPLLDVGSTAGRTSLVVRGTLYARAAKVEVLLRDNVSARFERGVYARTVSMPGYTSSSAGRVYTPFTLAGATSARADRRVRFDVTVAGRLRLSATVLFTDDGGTNPGAMVKILSYRPQ